MNVARALMRAASRLVSTLALFTSLGTLLCCALPSLLVLIGLGATVASFLSAAPWLVTLSHQKNWVFAVSGLLIAANFLYVYWLAPKLQAQGQACPADAPDTCNTASRASRVVLWLSAGLYLIGIFSAYFLGPLLMRLDSFHSTRQQQYTNCCVVPHGV